MPIDTVRINTRGKEQLSRLKRHTGIEHWNILCRWAFCTSLAEPTVPPAKSFGGEPAVEMTWRVFGGRQHEIYLALLKQRCKKDGFTMRDGTLSEQLRLHLHRGLSYLVSDRQIRNIADLIRKADLNDTGQSEATSPN